MQSAWASVSFYLQFWGLYDPASCPFHPGSPEQRQRICLNSPELSSWMEGTRAEREEGVNLKMRKVFHSKPFEDEKLRGCLNWRENANKKVIVCKKSNGRWVLSRNRPYLRICSNVSQNLTQMFAPSFTPLFSYACKFSTLHAWTYAKECFHS